VRLDVGYLAVLLATYWWTGIVLAGAGLAVHKTRVYTAYLLCVVLAAVAAVQIGDWLYLCAFLLGAANAFTEIITKFDDDPMKAFGTVEALGYHIFNGLISVLALYVLVLNHADTSTDPGRMQAVLVAGLGSMLIMRSKLFSIKVQDEVVSFGPEQFIKVFLGFMEQAIDRARAHARIEFVKATMDGIDCEQVQQYTIAMLDAPQLLPDADRAKLIVRINQLCKPSSEDPQLRAYRIGFALVDAMGEQFVASVFGANLPVVYRKAPTRNEPSSLIDRLRPHKDEYFWYFAYGADMSSSRLMRRLGWNKRDASGAWAGAKPFAATLPGYRLVFGSPSTTNPHEGRATIISDPTASVEGVVYRLPTDSLRYLDRSNAAYDRVRLPINRDGEEVFVAVYLSRTNTATALRPTRLYLDTLVAGAQEHGLSNGYIESLKTMPSIEEEAPAPPVRPRVRRAIQAAAAATTA
jgi:hypothetical protein